MLPAWTSDSVCSYHGHSLNICVGLSHDCCLLFHSSEFSLVRGTITGLVGPNGSGKTSLAKTIASKELVNFPKDLVIQYVSSHENYAFTEEEQGKLLPPEYMKSVVKIKLDELDQEIQKLEEAMGQNAEEVDDIAEHLGDLYEAYDELEGTADREIQHTLDELGFRPFMTTPVSQLSCGWRYKCRLVAAFTSSPDILIIDEPSFLDAASTAWLIRKTLHAAKAGKVMVLIISHKEMLLEKLCDRILCLNPSNHTLILYNCDYQTFRSTHQDEAVHAEQRCQEFQAKMNTAEKSLQSIQGQLQRREKNMKKNDHAKCRQALYQRQKQRSETKGRSICSSEVKAAKAGSIEYGTDKAPSST